MSSPTSGVGRPTAPLPAPPDTLEDWVRAGLLAPGQARAIRRYEAGRTGAGTSRGAGPSLVVEALGYLGGAVMLVGVGILVGAYWSDLPTPLRLALLGGTALALAGSGLAVPDRLGDAAGRLRSVLWAGCVVATAGFWGVLVAEVLDRRDEQALVVVGPVTAAVAAAFWWPRRTWVQQLALFVPVMVSAVGVGTELSSPGSSWGGAAMWAAGVAWAVVAWAGRLPPRPSGVALGVVGAMLGALTMDADVGVALGLATAFAAVGLALRERSLPWLGVAALMLLLTTPRAAEAWFPGRLSAALTLIVTGALLVGAAVWVARHRAGPGPAGGRPPG